MSLPLLISLFLSALVGVFPAASGTPAPAPAVVSVAADSAADQTPSSAHRCDDEPALPPAAPALRTVPASTGRTAVRALVDQDVQAARAPRAPPLRLV